MPIPIIPSNDRLASVELLGNILVLHWHDGHRGELPLATLRSNCPCATCGAPKPKSSKLKVIASGPPPQADDIQAIGRYALQFFWRDGHNTGIYSFDLLQQLCECPACAG